MHWLLHCGIPVSAFWAVDCLPAYPAPPSRQKHQLDCQLIRHPSYMANVREPCCSEQVQEIGHRRCCTQLHGRVEDAATCQQDNVQHLIQLETSESELCTFGCPPVCSSTHH
eukprot:334725-Chlamydomonas_euryale.AAC.2